MIRHVPTALVFMYLTSMEARGLEAISKSPFRLVNGFMLLVWPTSKPLQFTRMDNLSVVIDIPGPAQVHATITRKIDGLHPSAELRRFGSALEIARVFS